MESFMAVAWDLILLFFVIAPYTLLIFLMFYVVNSAEHNRRVRLEQRRSRKESKRAARN